MSDRKRDEMIFEVERGRLRQKAEMKADAIKILLFLAVLTFFLGWLQGLW
jgi:hypothetical protein